MADHLVVNTVRALTGIMAIFPGRSKFRNRKGGVVGSRRKCEGGRGTFPGGREDCKIWGKDGATTDVAEVLAKLGSNLQGVVNSSNLEGRHRGRRGLVLSR